MSFIRDFFRKRRLQRHLAQHGWVFPFHGRDVTIPPGSELAVANALMKGKYEAEEARLITKHLPTDRPVLELGGSLGVISGLIGSRLEQGVAHLIVEANPSLIETCQKNAGRTLSRVTCKAVSYDGPVARLEINSNPHASMLSSAGSASPNIVEVEAATLAQLWQEMGQPQNFTLVADIEGGEVAMVEQDMQTLAQAGLVIVELHPHLHPEGSKIISRIQEQMAEHGFCVVEQAADVYVWQKSKRPQEAAK